MAAVWRTELRGSASFEFIITMVFDMAATLEPKEDL
jgi:hypothetical protein